MQGILYKQARIDFLVGQIIEQNYYQKQAGMFSSAIGGARKALSVTAAKVGEIRNSVTAGVNKALFAKGEPTREVFKMGERRTVGGGIARENLPRTVTPTPTNSPAMFQAAQPRADFNVNSYKQDATARVNARNGKFDVNAYKSDAKARLAARPVEDHNTFEKAKAQVKGISPQTVAATMNNAEIPAGYRFNSSPQTKATTVRGQRPTYEAPTSSRNTVSPMSQNRQSNTPNSFSSPGLNRRNLTLDRNANEQLRGKRLMDIQNTIQGYNRKSEARAAGKYAW